MQVQRIWVTGNWLFNARRGFEVFLFHYVRNRVDNTLKICDMHLESWWVAVGNKSVCVAPAIASCVIESFLWPGGIRMYQTLLV